MYKVEVNMPNLPKGVPVEVDGLGVFENGATYEISEEEALAFRQKHVVIQTKYDDEGKMTNTPVLGPAVVDAFKDSETVKVTKGKLSDEDKAFRASTPQLPGLEEVNDNA